VRTKLKTTNYKLQILGVVLLAISPALAQVAAHDPTPVKAIGCGECRADRNASCKSGRGAVDASQEQAGGAD
jgi:hypothetical protein